MFVEKLEVFGFKSFNKKLELDFGPGISGVLGPNGCGKSNLVDAFRWVLGEQSTKTLRGEKMEDIIFNGTRDEKALAMAEVHLTLSNERKLLPVDYNQVTIGRRLYRSGQSEYTINRNPCRLKDVRDLFLDTGMGSHAYSVIERGMVDNVLSDNTGHRRFLFEEASGIMKYKTRKKEALNKLDATQGDLVRLFDIIHEVERETESLKRQVGKAQRYREFRDQLRAVELAFLQAKLQGFSDELSGLKESGETLSVEEQTVATRLSVAENRLEELKLREVESERALVSAREELSRLDATITDLNHQIVVLRERETATRDRITDANQQIERLKLRGEENETAAERAAEALAGHETAVVADREALAELEKEWRKADDSFRQQREVVGKKKQLSLDLFQEKMKREGDLRHCRSELDQALAARRELMEERENLAQRRADVSRRLETAKGQVSDLLNRLDDKGAELAGITANIEGLEKGLREAASREATLREESAGVTSSLSTLHNLRAGYEGFDRGVRSIMLEHGAEPDVLGTVADLVKVPAEWVGALRPVLGPALQWVVTRDRAAAERLIGDLTENEKGTVTFLPLDRLAPRDHHGVPSHAAVIGQARNLVQAPAEVRVLVDHLLGDVIVCDGLGHALDLSGRSEFAGFRFVTPEGELVAGPTISGGRSGDAGSDILGRAREIELLEEKLAGLNERIAAAEGECRSLETKKNEAQRALEAVRAELAGLGSERTAREAEAGRLEGELNVVEERDADLTLREAGLDSRGTALGESLGRLEGALSAVAEDSSTAEESWRNEENLLAELEARRETTQAAVHEAKIRRATRESALLECRERIERIAATAREIDAERTRLTAEIAEGEERLVRLAGEVEATADRVQEMHSGREAKVEAVSGCERVWSDLGEGVTAAEAEAREARRAANELRERAHGTELRLTELRSEFRNLEARLYEDYDMQAQALLEMGLEWPADEEGAPLTDEAVVAQVTEYKDRIKRLGPVNLLAIEEYEEKSTRLTFLQAQYNDLVQSKEQLLDAIRQINTTASELFNDTFRKVQENFQKTFLVLFQGGECSLQLVGDDPLEAEIEIVARPRGKKPQSIAQLSSGERALTAIALLFAIYLVKPSPFCLLDEVDAPLDDANVDRFVAMLKEFSSRTQFIVITHNKKTMEAADTLYGVTMASPGVSQVVSVRLSEAEAVRDGKSAGRARTRGKSAADPEADNGIGHRDEDPEEARDGVPPIADPVVQ